MATEALSAAKVIRKVRHKLEVSQEGLARLLNATKGAVQHWERGRNNPDLARLNALRQLLPKCPERAELDQLIKQTQARVAPLPGSLPVGQAGQAGKWRGGRGLPPPAYPSESFLLLRRENHRLQKTVAKLEAQARKRAEQLRILEDLAGDLQREMAQLRGGKASAEAAPTLAPAKSATE
jgi:transcriptional regulator with XRE-family HTH domain